MARGPERGRGGAGGKGGEDRSGGGSAGRGSAGGRGGGAFGKQRERGRSGAPRPVGDDAMPSREQILQFLEGAQGKVGKREIARAFGIKGGDKIALKKLLSQMAEEG